MLHRVEIPLSVEDQSLLSAPPCCSRLAEAPSLSSLKTGTSEGNQRLESIQGHLSNFVFLLKQVICPVQLSSHLFPKAQFCSHFSCLLKEALPERSLQHLHCSAMLLLLILVLEMIFALREIRAQSVTQPDVPVSVSEGDSLELRCIYSYSGTVYLYWYVQYPHKVPQLLLKYFPGDTLVKGIKGFEAEFRKNESSFNLRKHSAHWNDSADYFCAVSDTVLRTAGGAEHKPPETIGRISPQRNFC
ncbi:uncharacterized protein LOC111819117 [Trichechus manatus latirostris]|uniref:Uncharacterized protein LOC111819117 n=1 Tax=Trichechus manatus latirostris TaxID=127582 RepID=A0A2Y9QC78_TRIMA|nr:uncharacterized protein LOC111819117 [Trichechus manatus latirostris]